MNAPLRPAAGAEGLTASPGYGPTNAGAVAVSWVPMIAIALAQIQLGFNVNALVMSMGAIVADLNTSATTLGTALVVYSLAVAGLVMLGAQLASRIGARRAFQLGLAAQGLAMIWMALAGSATEMIAAQAIAGVAAAAAVPAFVVLIAASYRGKQQEQALGFLGAAQASSAMLAFLVVGLMGAVVSWRWAFALIVAMALVNLALSPRLKSDEPQGDVRIDWVGAFLAAMAISLISLGFNGVNDWGLLVATSSAPFDLGGLSPAPILFTIGIIFGQGFLVWLRRQRDAGGPELFALEVLGTRQERAATLALLITAALGPAINFLLPLYIQIVQGRSTAETAVAIVPYSLAIFASTIFVVRAYERYSPRTIGRAGFVAVAAGLFAMAGAINNDWGTPAVIASLIVVGLGEGALLTLMFNVLVSASPKELAGQVGALRGTVNNLATGLGTALAAIVATGALSLLIASSLAGNAVIPPTLAGEIDGIELDDVNFVSNDDLEALLAGSPATSEQVEEALRINEEARLRALKIAFLMLGMLALLGIIPAGGLPPYVPGELPDDLHAGWEVETEDLLPPASLAI